MDPITLIRDAAELDTTVEFEFQPGRFDGRFCQRGSVHVVMEVFSYLEPLVRRVCPDFDIAGPTLMPGARIEQLIAGLEAMAAAAGDARDIAELRAAGVGFDSPEVETEFAASFAPSSQALARLARDLAGWLRHQLQGEAEVTLLGV